MNCSKLYRILLLIFTASLSFSVFFLFLQFFILDHAVVTHFTRQQPTFDKFWFFFVVPSVFCSWLHSKLLFRLKKKNFSLLFSLFNWNVRQMSYRHSRTHSKQLRMPKIQFTLLAFSVLIFRCTSENPFLCSSTVVHNFWSRNFTRICQAESYKVKHKPKKNNNKKNGNGSTQNHRM